MQDPWIQNATVRDNILMCAVYDEARYREVVATCALEQDLATLPKGDATEIGEKGVTLSGTQLRGLVACPAELLSLDILACMHDMHQTPLAPHPQSLYRRTPSKQSMPRNMCRSHAGGQKHRVALARACYAGAGVVLLDDPLSAVDAHVQRMLMQDVVCGVLGKATRVLVTHQLQFLPQADLVVKMEHGRIVATGTYNELVAQGVELSELQFTETGEILPGCIVSLGYRLCTLLRDAVPM